MSSTNETDRRQFVDTNILVYAHDPSANQKNNKAEDLLDELWESGHGCISIQVLQEFYVSITSKVAKPYQPVTASQIISNFESWELHRPTVPDILDAIQTHVHYQISFWDALIITSAQQLGCRTLWTEDLNHGQRYGHVTVQNPFV